MCIRDRGQGDVGVIYRLAGVGAKIAVFYAALFQVALYGLFQLKAAVVCAQCNRFCHAKNFLSA